MSQTSESSSICICLPFPTSPPTPTPTPTPTPQCFANFALTPVCGESAAFAFMINECPPTIITPGPNFPRQPVIFGCQSGQFSTFSDSNNIFLQIPPNCGGCYKVDLHISGYFTGSTLPNSLMFGVCRNGDPDFITPIVIIHIDGTIINQPGNSIPFNVSTSGNVCLQTGDLIAPCAATSNNSLNIFVTSFSLNIVRLGDC